MAKSELRWVVRDGRGRIFGPFKANKVIYYIERGNFTGIEQVAHYPGGQWHSISKVPEFYEALLLSITPDSTKSKASDLEEFELKEHNSKSVSHNNLEDDEGGRAVPEEPEKYKVVTPEPQAEAKPSGPKVRKITPQKSNDVIELSNVGDWLRFEKKRRTQLPIAIAFMAAVVALGIWIIMPGPSRLNNTGKIRLLAPKRGQSPLDQQAVLKKYAKAIAGFQRDSFDGLVVAQNELIQVLEGAPKNTDALALLCLTHRELWPYTTQDSKDLMAAKTVAQSAFQLDPAGYNGAICKSSDLILSGRYTEALSQVDAALEQFPTTTVLYQIRAELLASKRNFDVAVDYSRKAQQLWPQWLKPFVAQATYLAELDRFGEADQLLRKVLQDNPNHAGAKVELGVVQMKHFRNYDSALDYLQSAVKSQIRMTPMIEGKAYWALARVYAARNENSKALEAARKCYQLSGANGECRTLIVQLGGQDSLKEIKVENREALFLGDQYAKAGDCFAAQAEYKAAFEADNKNGLAAMKAAKCLWQLSYSTESIEWLEKAIKADPQLTEAYSSLADYYAQRYDYDGAYRMLGQIIKRFPKDYRVFHGYALVEFRRRNFKAALTYLERSRALYEGDVETYILMAKCFIGLGKFAEAFEQATKAVEMDYNHIPAQSVYAKALGSARGMVEGINYLQQLINTYPTVSEYKITLGEMLAQDEKYSDARSVYRQILQGGVENKQVFLQLGDVEQAMNNADEALRLYLRAAAVDPSDAEPFFRAGVLYFVTKKYISARAQFDRTLQANPRYPSAHFYLGRVALELNNIPLALQEAGKERRLNPSLADAYLLSAEAYSRSSQYRECAGEYQKAIKLRPQGSDIYVRIAKCYRLAGNLDVALSMLKVAADQESGNADIYKEQGAIYQMKGDNAAAVEAFDKYLSLSPTAVDRATIERAKASLH